MQVTLELVVTTSVQIAAIGIFIGMTKTSLAAITERLKRIEDKQDKQNEEIVELRERVAVIESVLEIKKHKAS